MSAKTNSTSKIISAKDDNPLSGALIVLYGIGGIGKTTVACRAPGNVLVLDCADGAAGKGVDRWPIVTSADFREAVAFLKAGGHGYTTAVLDGYDFLYARTVQSQTGESLERHRRAQETIHPSLYDFLALPLLKVMVLNERKRVDLKNTARRQAVLDLSPRAAELVDNAAHVLARCEMRSGAAEATIRVRRVDTDTMYIPAKSRFDALADGNKLSELWVKLGAAHTPAPTGNGQPTGEIPGEIVVPTNLTEAVRYVNHQIGQSYFRANDHLENVLKKHGNGIPADGDRKGWEEATAIALEYANGQLHAPAQAATTNGAEQVA